jgi:hypothetical protein
VPIGRGQRELIIGDRQTGLVCVNHVKDFVPQKYLPPICLEKLKGFGLNVSGTKLLECAKSRNLGTSWM